MNSIYGDATKILYGCPVCRCRIFQEVTVIPNSYQCTGCGAWVLLAPVPEPEPHHNLD